MKALKWILGFALALLIIAVSGAWVFAQFYLEPYLKRQIEARGSAALGSPLTVNAVKIGLLPPLKAHVLGIKTTLPKPAASVEIERLTVIAHVGRGVADPSAPLGRFEIHIEKPVISAVLPGAAETAPSAGRAEEPPEPAAGNPLEGQRDLSAEIRVNDATIDVKYEGLDRAARLSPLSLSLTIPSLKGPWSIRLDSRNAVSWDGIRLDAPIKTQAEFKYDGAHVAISKAEGNIGGLLFAANGEQALATGTRAGGRWNLQVNVADLSKLPAPPSFLPPGRFTGQIQADINAKTGADGAWAADGAIHVRRFQGEGAFAFKDAKAAGLIAADAAIEFDYSGGALLLPKAQAVVSLDGAEIAYSNLFAKPKTVPLNLRIDAVGDARKIELRELKLVFAELNAQAKGSLALGEGSGAASRIGIDVARTSLAGWEAYFPVLAGAPVTGFIELKANIEGDPRDPETLNVALTPLLLENVKGRARWASADRTQSVSGPIEIDARANVRARGKELLNASLSADAQLTGLSIKKKDVFEKRAGQPMRLSLKADKKGGVIELKPSLLALGQSRLQASGRVREPQRPKLDLHLSSPKLVFKELGAFLPAVRDLLPEGTGVFKADLGGTFDFKLGVQGSPLKAKADFSAVIPRYAFQSTASPAAGGKAAPTAAAPEPQPLLPDWPVLRDSAILSNVRVDGFQFNDLPAQGVHARLALNQGVLTGGIEITKIFGGSTQLSNMRADLKQAQPDFEARARFKGIDADAAMTWVSKDWKNLVKGSASGELAARLAHPSRADFVARTRADGDVTLTDAFVSTLQFDKAANDVLAKIPGVGDDRRVASKGVAADVRVSLAWEKNRALIRNFVFLTPENNQISLNGVIDPQKNLDLSGTAYLATAPVKGSVREANSDANGRFTIPIQIKGNMLQPRASFAQASIEGILKNTANHELKKAQGKAQARIKEEQRKLEGKAKSEIDKLGDKIKKEGLKGLFK